MSTPKIHIIGGGIAGLSAAIFLKSQHYPVTVYESSKNAGGRCRSFYDDDLECEIDNGTHMILGCNQNVFDYLNLIGSAESLTAYDPIYRFYNFETDQKWSLDFHNVFRLLTSKVPNVKKTDFLKLFGLMCAAEDRDLSDLSPALYQNMIGPMEQAILNTANGEGQAKLLGAVLKKLICSMKKSATPYLAQESLKKSFVDPALEILKQDFLYKHRLRDIAYEDDRVVSLTFDDQEVDVKNDVVIFALPVQQVSKLLPGFTGPDKFESIINLHFKNPGIDEAGFFGGVKGLCEWVFVHQNTISVTISAANRYKKLSQDQIKKNAWDEICQFFEIENPQPVCQLVWEKRATFYQSPDQVLKRPEAKTAYKNLYLCGDYVNTLLPSTLESTILSSRNVCRIVHGGKI